MPSQGHQDHRGPLGCRNRCMKHALASGRGKLGDPMNDRYPANAIEVPTGTCAVRIRGSVPRAPPTRLVGRWRLDWWGDASPARVGAASVLGS